MNLRHRKPEIQERAESMNSSTPVNILFGLMALASLELCIALVFILHVETLAKGIPWSRQNVATPFNLSLISMIASLILTFGCRIPRILGHELSMSDFFNTFFVSTFEVAYLFYSWARAKAVVAKVFPSLVKVLKFLTMSSPVICLLQNVPMGLLVWFPDAKAENNQNMFAFLVKTTQLCSAVAGILAVSFDVILLVSFIRFLRQTVSESKEVADKRFTIISGYGSAGIVCLLTALAFYMMYNRNNDPMYMMTTYFFLLLTSALLLAMKISLYHEKERKQSVHSALLKQIDVEDSKVKPLNGVNTIQSVRSVRSVGSSQVNEKSALTVHSSTSKGTVSQS
ncbi:UNVERIFIED_CONTAM: hypothetical protein HDU68_003882 [Siphonaria sp. JEL0065]|nr:hypothetical protein HDU68_003882 [Siphonaria sp. JEL0065]